MTETAVEAAAEVVEPVTSIVSPIGDDVMALESNSVLEAETSYMKVQDSLPVWRETGLDRRRPPFLSASTSSSRSFTLSSLSL